MPDLDTIRTAAAVHETQLQSATWLGTRDLMARWGLGRDTVLEIPREQLPYLSFGTSKMRRYKPEDVEAFEATRVDAQEKAS